MNNVVVILILVIDLLFLAGCGSAYEDAIGDNGDNHSQTIPSRNWVAGDLVITEIMANPAYLTDNDGEYIEIYNNTSDVVSLEGLVIKFPSTQTIVFSDAIINPGSYALIGKNSSSYTGTNGWTSASFVDTGSSVEISINGVTIDSVTYPVAVSGSSYQLSNNQTDHISNDSSSNWCSSSVQINPTNTDKGTPKTSNAFCP